MSGEPLAEESFALLFRAARTYHSWQDRPIAPEVLRRLYDTMKWGPTSANSSPARIVFLASETAKAKLLPVLMEGNRAQTEAAPVSAIIAYDSRFFELMPRLYPAVPGFGQLFAADEDLAYTTALRNSALQGGYFILAARALGLDCGPMSGFDGEALDKAFFPAGGWRSNFLCNLGYGAPDGLHPRGPRLDFDEACQLL